MFRKMISEIHVGDRFAVGCVDRVIVIHHGARKSEYYTYSMEYECLFRISGKWYMYEECDGQNGGAMTTTLSSVTDSTVETLAEERKAKWRKRL